MVASFSFAVMTAVVWLCRAMFAVWLIMSLNGCIPAGQSELDEEKEPHFLAGKKAINTMDYRGAIEEFEKAVEVNPRNSKAHQQLGWLYEEKESEPAAAIYHYEKYLKLRPSSDNAEVIRQRVVNCKQDLAKSVLPLPITPGMQRQFDQLVDENKRLKEENDRWKAHFASLGAAVTNPASHAAVQHIWSGQTNTRSVATNSAPPNMAGSRIPNLAARTHVVQSGDTAAAIARKYNVKLAALLAANPTLDPRRMRVGQTVIIPAGNR